MGPGFIYALLFLIIINLLFIYFIIVFIFDRAGSSLRHAGSLQLW